MNLVLRNEARKKSSVSHPSWCLFLQIIQVAYHKHIANLTELDATQKLQTILLFTSADKTFSITSYKYIWLFFFLQITVFLKSKASISVFLIFTYFRNMALTKNNYTQLSLFTTYITVF